MHVTAVELENWRNFRRLPRTRVPDRLFVIGPNASGKSNFLDVFRFLRDVALPVGRRPGPGGLQAAVRDREGLPKVRSLYAHGKPGVRISVDLADGETTWSYTLAFRGEGKGKNRIVVSKELVEKSGKVLLSRPDANDDADPELLTQTALENMSRNKAFRSISQFFADVTYLHLVPQLVKYGERIGGTKLEHDPFGQAFLERIAETPERTRDSRLNRIQAALANVVPEFQKLRFEADPIDGRPHLFAEFEHWRPNAAKQRESQFSDGTLRLIALFWSILEGNSLLLLEEPELSLDEEVVRSIGRLLRKVQRANKAQRQLLITTHSEALLDGADLEDDEVLRLAPGRDGTTTRPLGPEERAMVKGGFSVGATMLRSTKAPVQLSLLE